MNLEQLERLAEIGATEGERRAARAALDRLQSKRTAERAPAPEIRVESVKLRGRTVWTAFVGGILKFSSIHRERVYREVGLTSPPRARRVDVWV